MNGHLHPTMRTALRGFCMPFATRNPHADAERWEDELEALAERDAAHQIELADAFIDAVRAGRTAPHGEVMDAALDELVGEHPELFRLLLGAAVSAPAMHAAVAAVADAYVEHFRRLLPDSNPCALEHA